MVNCLLKERGSVNYITLDCNDNLQTENDRPVFTVAQKYELNLNFRLH